MAHTPVLLHEAITLLRPRPGSFIIDGTVGSGGHAEHIIEKIGEKGMFLGIDWDSSTLAALREEMKDRANVVLAHGNYADIPDILEKKRLPKADGLLLDLGFSSQQIAHSGRGFSFKRDEPLRMTYDEHRIPVSELIKQMTEEELRNVLSEYGEERYAKRIARAIHERRRANPIATSGELADVVKSAVPRAYERGRIHPATRTFQALRIYANDELENIKKVLGELPEILRTGGRAVVISFHSLEDRIVKHAFREMQRKDVLEIITKKPKEASRDEIKQNPRSRSAKLRAATVI